MDFKYLIRAESDAYPLNDEPDARQHGWDYGCDYQVLYKFENPLTLEDLRRDPSMEEWGAFRANFQRSVYAIPDSTWQRLLHQMEKIEPRFAHFLHRAKIETHGPTLAREATRKSSRQRHLASVRTRN